MMKSRTTGGRADVTFVLDAAVGAKKASVCGDFNQWSGSSHAMVRADDGSLSLTISLETGRRYRFRYLLDGDRWENDWAADEYVPNDFGGDDSLLDLTTLAEEVPPVTPAPPPASRRDAPAKNAPASTPVAKRAAPRKAVAKKAAPTDAPAESAAADTPVAAKAAPKEVAAKMSAPKNTMAKKAAGKKVGGRKTTDVAVAKRPRD